MPFSLSLRRFIFDHITCHISAVLDGYKAIQFFTGIVAFISIKVLIAL